MKYRPFLALLLALAPSWSASAMSLNPELPLRCTVTGAEKLPDGIGGAQSVCAAISAAVLPALARVGLRAEAVAVAVKVRSASRVSAVPSINAKALPEQHVASSDRSLSSRSIAMLAKAVAAELSKPHMTPDAGK